MKRLMRRVLVAGLLLVGASIVWAEDTVYIQEPGKKSGDSLKGMIEDETPSGIKLKTSSGVKEIPTTQITQVAYQCKVAAIEFRRPDGQFIRALAEKSEDERTKLLRSALTGFQELDSRLSGEERVHRYLQYRIALTLAALAKDDPARRDAAIKVLKDNQKGFADGWEIVPALQLLARLQEEKGDVEAAGRAYSDLAEIPGISAAMKLDSQLHGARLLLSARKFAEAESRLKQLASALPAEDPQRTQVDVYLAQTQIAQNNLDGIEKKLKDAITANEDKKLRALAHNALGDYYRAKKDLEMAFWEYLKVETMYDVDREEEAKALYWLSKLFDKPKNDLTRADECLAKLQGQRFDGTPYQRKAASEKKTP